MANKASPIQENQQDSESDDEEVVETSPCGRWEKHRKEVGRVGLFSFIYSVGLFTLSSSSCLCLIPLSISYSIKLNM